MKRRRLAALAATTVLVVTLSAGGCRTGAPEGTRAKRLVLVSYDGLGADLLDEWLRDPSIATAGGLGGLAADGVRADRVRMANPTLTAVNHVSLITGALPRDTGIVSNSYHQPDQRLTDRTNGYEATSEVPPLWVDTRAAGIRTGVLLWPGIDFTRPERSADFGIAWPNRPLVRSRIEDLEPSAAEMEPELPSTDGLPALRWRLPLRARSGEVATIEVAVLDAEPDGRPSYQTVAVRTAGDVSWHYHEARDWFETTVQAARGDDQGEATFGAWSKVLELEPTTGALRLYRGAFNRLIAYPEAFASDLEEAVGPWPGTPDDHFLRDWWLDGSRGIDLDTYSEQVERLDRYLDAIAAWVFDHEDFGLLVAYHPNPDEYQHSSLIVDKKQWAWSEGREIAAREGLRRAGRSIDRSVTSMWSALDPAEDVLVVVSDHGQLPIHDVVLFNRALADAGLVDTVTRGDRESVSPESPMIMVTSGAMGHLYLNLSGREPGGVVDPKDGDVLLRNAAKVIADIGVDGEPVVERIAARDELPALGLDNPNSGDLVVFLKPGFAASSSLNGEVIRPSDYYGQHGYLNHYDALCGIFLARGAPAGRGRIKTMTVTGVAPRVRGWLGLAK